MTIKIELKPLHIVYLNQPLKIVLVLFLFPETLTYSVFKLAKWLLVPCSTASETLTYSVFKSTAQLRINCTDFTETLTYSVFKL